MAAPRLIRIESISQLRDAADAWDDLWRRSEVALPIARAELIAQWIEAAAHRRRLHALAIEQDGQFVAALPMLHGRLKRLLTVAGLPSNHWSWAGDLLLDPSADLDSVLAMLADALAHVPVRLLWLEGVALASPRWTRLATALNAQGLDVVGRELFRVGQVEISHDWDAYRASWSSNHRHHMRRMEKRVQAVPGLRLTVISDARPEQVAPLLRRGFEVEARGWKGSQGTAVLNSPTEFAYYCRQARQLAEWGQLQLTFLEQADRAIAFEYGWNAKGVYCSPKVGYDEAFARLSPGQLLRHELLKQFFADPRQRVFDFMGPLADATAKWITNSYLVGRLVVSTTRRGSRSLVRLLRRRWSCAGVNAASRQTNGEERRPAEPDCAGLGLARIC
jgi:CelD/BcsL family acetyltransferase involved in cellulose biosynthesis